MEVVISDSDNKSNAVISVKAQIDIPITNIDSQSASSSDLTNPRDDIIRGCRSTPPYLPSLLLWDDLGIERFDAFARSPDYYPSHTELTMLHRHAGRMAQAIPPGSTVIELGSGNLQKISILLSYFQKLHRAIKYHALDVSAGILFDNLETLSERFADCPFIDIQGLNGTYEDCVAWLATAACGLASGETVTFLWFGNSIANMHPHEAGALLKRFASACSLARLQCQFFIAVDACSDPVRISEAYSLDCTSHREFLLGGLDSANRIFGQPVFDLAEFDIETEFQAERRLFQVYYRVKHDLKLSFPDAEENTTSQSEYALLQKGQRMGIIRSYKWSPYDMFHICNLASLKTRQTLKDCDIDYFIYHVAP
nr:AzoB [Aspergillus insulicola]